MDTRQRCEKDIVRKDNVGCDHQVGVRRWGAGGRWERITDEGRFLLFDLGLPPVLIYADQEYLTRLRQAFGSTHIWRTIDLPTKIPCLRFSLTVWNIHCVAVLTSWNKILCHNFAAGILYTFLDDAKIPPFD